MPNFRALDLSREYCYKEKPAGLKTAVENYLFNGNIVQIQSHS
jgi:hypothetical protein